MGARRRNRDTAQWQAGYDYHRDFIDTMALSEGGEYDRGFAAGYDDGHEAGYKLGMASAHEALQKQFGQQPHQPGGVTYNLPVPIVTTTPPVGYLRPGPGTVTTFTLTRDLPPDVTDHHFVD